VWHKSGCRPAYLNEDNQLPRDLVVARSSRGVGFLKETWVRKNGIDEHNTRIKVSINVTAFKKPGPAVRNQHRHSV
jgi:hypothetical protein